MKRLLVTAGAMAAGVFSATLKDDDYLGEAN